MARCDILGKIEENEDRVSPERRDLVAWLQSDGKLGAPTDWYLLISEARFANVAAWELAGVPESAGLECWRYWIACSQDAEAKARIAHRKRKR